MPLLLTLLARLELLSRPAIITAQLEHIQSLSSLYICMCLSVFLSLCSAILTNKRVQTCSYTCAGDERTISRREETGASPQRQRVRQKRQIGCFRARQRTCGSGAEDMAEMPASRNTRQQRRLTQLHTYFARGNETKRD